MRITLLTCVAVMATRCTSAELVCDPDNVPVDTLGQHVSVRSTFALNGTSTEECATLCQKTSCAAYTCGLPKPECLCVLYCTDNPTFSRCSNQLGRCSHSEIVNTTHYFIETNADAINGDNKHATIYAVLAVFACALSIFACYTQFPDQPANDVTNLTLALVAEDPFDEPIIRDVITPITPPITQVTELDASHEHNHTSNIHIPLNSDLTDPYQETSA